MEMAHDPLLTFLLALVALCAVVITFSMLLTATSLWRATHRLELLLSHGEAAVRETRHALGLATGAVRNLFGKFPFFGRGGRPHLRSGSHRTASHVTNKRRVS